MARRPVYSSGSVARWNILSMRTVIVKPPPMLIACEARPQRREQTGANIEV